METTEECEDEMLSEMLGGLGLGTKSARFIPRGVGRSPFIPPGGPFPKNAGDIVFEDRAGRALCWRMGHQSAGEFIKGRYGFPLRGANDRLFHTGKIKIFFPIISKNVGNYHATRSMTLKANSTLARVLSAIQVCAYHAVADHMIKDLFAPKVTIGEILVALDRVVCCHLVCSRAGGWNHVYVRVT